jgi:ribose 5-phosphate isomerase B
MKIALGYDVGGAALRAAVVIALMADGHEVLDLGANSTSSGIDADEVIRAVAAAVVTGRVDRGVLCASSGVALSLAANRFEGIHAGACSDTYMAVQGVAGGMNVLCLGTQTVDKAKAAAIVAAYAGGFRVPASRLRRPVAGVFGAL